MLRALRIMSTNRCFLAGFWSGELHLCSEESRTRNQSYHTQTRAERECDRQTDGQTDKLRNAISDVTEPWRPRSETDSRLSAASPSPWSPSPWIQRYTQQQQQQQSLLVDYRRSSSSSSSSVTSSLTSSADSSEWINDGAL